MFLSTSWFHTLSSSDTDIRIAPNVSVRVFDRSESALDRKITLAEGSNVEWYSLVCGSQQSSLEIVHEWVGSKSFVRTVIFAEQDEKIQMTIRSVVRALGCDTDLHIGSFVASGGSVDLDASVEMAPESGDSTGSLLEENIFLGDSGSVRGVPALLVRSDRARASHALRIERVSDETLFYLRSRGIPADDATIMLLEGKLRTLLGEVAEIDFDVVLAEFRERFFGE